MIFWSYSFYVLSQKLHLQKPIYRRNQQFTTVCPWLVTCDYTPDFVCWSFQTLVQPSVTLLFWGFWGLWPHCSCPSDQVTSDTAPAHSHRTWVAMYLSLFKHNIYYMVPRHSDNKAGYTASPVACRWAGSVFEVTWSLGQEQWGQRPQKPKKSKVWWTDQRTDGRTDKAGCRVA